MKGGSLQGILAACMYGLFSASLIFINKIVVSIFDFRFPMILTLGQMTFCIVMLKTLDLLGFIQLPTITKTMAKKVFLLSIAFTGNAVVGFIALRTVNVPMYGALRRFTIIFVMLAEAYILKQSHSIPKKVSVFIMVFGAFLAGVGDLNFDLVGYCWLMVNNFFTASYLVMVKRVNAEYELNILILLYVNNILSYPFMLVLTWFTGEFGHLSTYPHLFLPSFLSMYVLSSVCALGLNYAIYRCTTLNSPLATSVTGQLMNIGVTLIGYFAFDDVFYDPRNVAGLGVAMLGSVYYAYIGFQSQKSAQVKLHSDDDVEKQPLKERA